MATKQWKDMTGKEKMTGIVGLIVVVIILVVIFNALGSKSENKSANSQQQTVDQSLTEDQQLKQLVTNVLPGKNSNDQEYIRKIDATKQPEGGYSVVVEYNAENFKKILIDEEMANIYIALYTSDKDVRNASVSAYHSLMDQYGNESDRVVYKTMLDKDTASKVNFNTDKAALQVSILPGVWQTTILHQDLK